MMMHIYEIHCTEVFRLVVMGMCKVNLEPWQAEALVFQLTAWQVKRLADNLGNIGSVVISSHQQLL